MYNYVCSNVIPVTMNVFIFRNLLLKIALLSHMSKYIIRYRYRYYYRLNKI